jgi:hypothetical protein
MYYPNEPKEKIYFNLSNLNGISEDTTSNFYYNSSNSNCFDYDFYFYKESESNENANSNEIHQNNQTEKVYRKEKIIYIENKENIINDKINNNISNEEIIQKDIKNIQEIVFKYALNESKIKIGNKTEKKSSRKSNQLNMIKRNFIQNICPYWINYGEKDDTQKINKLNPKVLYKDYKNMKLKDIYYQDITVKEKDKAHNQKIIDSAKGIKKLKLELSYENALKLFFNVNVGEIELLKIIPNLRDKKRFNLKINYKEFLKGLKGYKEFLKEKGGKPGYYKKLKENLIIFEKMYIK